MTPSTQVLLDALRKISSCESHFAGDVVDIARSSLAAYEAAAKVETCPKFLSDFEHAEECYVSAHPESDECGCGLLHARVDSLRWRRKP